MEKISDQRYIDMMRQCFIPTGRYYHRHSSYALKHVLQQRDERFYMPEWEFIRLMKEAGYECKPTAGQSVKIKVWVRIDERVRRELWGMGDDAKLMDLEL